MHVAHLLFKTHCAGNLEVGKAIHLCRSQQFLIQYVHTGASLQGLVDVDDVLQFFQKPLVDLREFVYLVDGISLVHGLRDDEHTLVGGFAKGGINVVNFQFLVLNEAVHALANHTQSLLYCLFKVSADGHNLANRFHR